MHWLSSLGGPFIVMPASVLPLWMGVSEQAGRISDYSRACEIASCNEIGALSVGSRTCLVLGGEPLDTTWLKGARCGGGILCRWMCAESDTEAESALEQAWSQQFVDTGLSLTVRDSAWLLTDCAIPGPKVKANEVLSFSLEHGKYNVQMCTYQPDAVTEFILVRLRLVEPKV